MKARWKDLAAMLLIGDGLLGLIEPKRHSAVWECGPESYKEFARTLEHKPNVARAIGASFIALGLWLSRGA
jgi:hypothetical protein